MRVTGIIAEFNPFHNGHAYLLQRAREITGADVLVVAMSGSFVQRGAPAIVSKYARAKAALCCGADLIAELPVFASCASAEYFAQGALRLLCDLGADSFVFGSESGSLSALQPLSALLCDEPAAYKKHLRDGLSSGKSFPAARREAVAALLPDAAPLLDTPNNLLALEYLKACRKRGFSLRPYTVARLGSPYHGQALPEGMPDGEDPTGKVPSSRSFPSASALRKFIAADTPKQAALLPYMPEAASEILAGEIAANSLVYESDLSSLLAWQLLQCSCPAELAVYADMGNELANRVYARRYESIQLPDFVMDLKTRELTHTRISRALLHTVLQLYGGEQEDFSALPHSPYVRILGMRPAAHPLLARLKKEGAAPLLMRPALAKKLLLPQARQFFRKDIATAELYRQLSFARSRLLSACEFTHEIIRVE